MRTAILGILMLATAAIGQERATQFPPTLVDPVLDLCTVKVKRELLMPAKDNGALVKLGVEQGNIVEKDAVLARMDDNEAVAAQAVAMAEWETSKLNAGEGSLIQIKFAQSAADLAQTEYQELQEVAKSRAVTKWDLRRSELEWIKGNAQVEVRELEQKLAGFEVGGKAAALQAADNAVARRSLTAPYAGVVVETYRREGEWVQAGEPILRLMNFETMVVSGKVDAKEYLRQELVGRPVTVEIDLARGEKAEFEGQITFVSPILDGQNKKITVEAEVVNRQVGEQWLLPHGVFARMRIHMN